MAVTADRVIVELEAKLDRYEQNVRRAEAKFDAATRGIANDAKRMEREVSRNADAVGQRFRALAGTVAAAFSAQQIAQLADGYTRFTNQLSVAGLEGANLAGVQESLFATAQKYGVELESLGTLYSRSSQSAKELGASTDDLLKFTNGVSAAIKIQGSSAAESSGALLQLSQALGAGIVRAEEYNSINEGALPILKAVAANLDGAGGSVAKLRALVNDGKVTSQAFFEAFLAGSADLEAQAEKASLTIGNSFTVLKNALGKYIGEADASLSATEQISGAIISLSENLDTVAAALGVIAALLLGRFVAGMVAATATTGVTSAAIFALQARAAGAATTMEALAFTSAAAGRSMLAAFGGPVGLAVSALTLGVLYLSQRSAEAEAAAAGLTASIEAQAASFQTLEARQAAADAAADRLDATQRAAITSTANLTGEANLLATAWGRVAAQAKAAAIEQAKAAVVTARTNARAAAEAEQAARETAFDRAARRPFAERGLGRDAPASNPRQAIAAADAATKKERELANRATRNLTLAEQELARVQNERLAEFRAPDPAPAPAKPDKKTGRTPGGPSGRTIDPEAAANQFADDVARGELALRQALADAVGTAAARREVEREAIRVEQESAARAIKSDDDLTPLQREKLLLLNDQIRAARLAAIAADAEREAIENSLLLRESDLRNQQDTLRLQSSLADTAKERREIELRLLDLQYEEERLRLQMIADNTTLAEAEREAARRRLASLDEQQGLEREGVRRNTEGPLERRRRELDRSPEQLEEAAEQWVVDTLDSVQDKLRNAIQSKLGIDDPILGGILDLFIEQAILRPLADAFSKAGSGGGGGGGLFGAIGSALGSIFGGSKAPARASGGHVVGGKMYRVNETGVEGFQPAGSGKIIPLGRMRGASGAGGVAGAVTVSLILSGDIEERIRQVSGPVAVEVMRQAAPVIVENAVGETFNRSQRPQM